MGTILNQPVDNLSVVKGLNPASLWHHFANLASIPRPSGAEAKVLDYIEGVSLKNKGVCRRDLVGNLLVSIPGLAGRSGEKTLSPLVFQGHVDMVCEQNSHGKHDFHRDPIRLTKRPEQPGWIFGSGTTLGADNGIGVAAMLAMMEEAKGFSRGTEFLFTVDEETGLTGAQGLGPDLLTGDTLLNLDTEEEGALYVGCAGGLDLDAHWRCSRMLSQDPKFETFRLEVSGLKGGHSGIDIDKQRGNAVKLLAYVLDNLLALATEQMLQVISLNGGKARNAIPREAVALVAVYSEAQKHLIALTKELEDKLKEIYKEADPQLKISLSPHPDPTDWPPMDPRVAKKWIKAILGFPSQPYRFELGIAGLVRTSSNLGVIETEKNQITIRSKLRSSSDLELEVLKKELTTVLELADGQVKVGGGYCGWQPDLQSSLLRTAQAVHAEVFGHKAEVKAIHAGLECGLIGSRYPKMKMISFGPNIVNAHSPDEAVEVASVERFWTYLKALVQMLQEQTRILSD